MTIPTYLPYYVLIGSIVVITTILFGLRNALANSDWPQPGRTKTIRWSTVVLIGWFLFSLALGLAGAYQAGAERIPTIQYGIAIPILIGAWLMAVTYGEPDDRRRSAAVDYRGATLSSAWCDLSNPLCD
jgi:hypothetical protein